MKKTLLFLALAITWVFTVNAQVSFSTPAGGESWEYGTTHQIDILNSGGDINTECMVWIIWDSGSQSNTLEIFVPLPSGISSFNWTVDPTTYTPSNDYYFEIRDNNDNSLIATSNTFTVVATSVVFRIDAPGASSTWISGQNRTIEWFSYQISDVKIEYNLDDGNGWQTIENSFAVNEGYNSYNWAIPGITGTNSNSLIKISDVSNASTYKESETFTLSGSAPVTFTNPTTGDQWEIGTIHSIDFTFSGTSSFGGDIVLYDNNDTQIDNIGYITVNNGANSFNWDIGASFSPVNDCYLAIIDGSNNNVGTSEHFDLLAAQPNVTQVSQPTANNYVINGQDIAIYWGTVGGVTNVKIEYTTNNGSSWNTITPSNPTADGNSNYYNWSVSGISGTNPQSIIRVSDVDDATRFALSDTFTLAANSPVSFTTPTSTTQWTVGTIQNIIIEYTGTSNLDAEIQFFDNGNQIWSPSLDYVILTNGTNQFAWNIDPNSGFNPTTNMVIKVTDGNTTIYATSDEFELVTASTPTLSADQASIVFPNTIIGNTSGKGITIVGVALTNNVTLSLTQANDFKIWDDANSQWVTNFSVSPNSGNLNTYLNIEFTASTNGTSLDTLVIESTGATTILVPLSANAVTGINDITDNSINIFPNPNNGNFNINLESTPTNANINIYNMSGRVVLTKQLNSIENNIQLNNTNADVYFVKITNNNKLIIKKIVVE